MEKMCSNYIFNFTKFYEIRNCIYCTSLWAQRPR